MCLEKSFKVQEAERESATDLRCIVGQIEERSLDLGCKGLISQRGIVEPCKRLASVLVPVRIWAAEL